MGPERFEARVREEFLACGASPAYDVGERGGAVVGIEITPG